MTVSAPCAIDKASRLPPVTDSYDYDVFGNKINSTGTTPNNYLYRGEQFDSDLGLYYLRARYYNPITGRFMSRDPEDHALLAPNELHKYLYAGGDPIDGIDPTGRGDLISEVISLGREIAKVPSIRFIAYENVLCIAGIGDTIWSIANGNPPSPIGWSMLGIACGTAELHNILFIAALIP
jgi:RHS repeat-associated protein